MTIEALSPEWVEALASASAERDGADLGGVVAVTIGKTRRAVFEIAGGRVVGASDAEPGVAIPVTGAQLDAWTRGELDLSVAYMRGDIKPEGSTGTLLAALEVLSDPQVSVNLRAALG